MTKLDKRQSRMVPEGKSTPPLKAPDTIPICRDLPDGVDRACLLREDPPKYHYPEQKKPEPEELPEQWKNLYTKRRKS